MSENTTFDSDSFAQGRFRYAYKGNWTNPPSKAGQLCVIKKFKNSYTWEGTGGDTTMKIYSKAQEYANNFHGGRVEVTNCNVHAVTKSANAPRRIRLGEYVVAKEYLEGDFKKWCNNYGYISKEARGEDYILPSFMHWSWIHNKGQEMVGDLQGVKQGGSMYKLTDPAIMSINREYGVTDTGIEGMAMVFLVHGYSDICRGFPKPTLAQFVGKIPDDMMHQALAFQQLSARGKTYSHEMKFSDPEITMP